MSKIISMYDLNKIKKSKLRIFEAEDEDIPNNRIIARNERILDKVLKKYNDKEQQELIENIRWQNDNCAIELEKLGWTITKEKNKI